MMGLRAAALVVAFAVAAAAMFPLRAALSAANAPEDLKVANVTGTIWDGRLTGVTWRNVLLGDFNAAISPLDLFPTPALHLDRGSGPLRSGVLRSTDARFVVSEASINLRLADIVRSAPSELTARITNGALTLHKGGCTDAAGEIDLPASLPRGLPGFTGSLTCDHGAIVAQLKSDVGAAVLEISPAFDRVGFRSGAPTLEIAFAAIGIARSDWQPGS